MAALAITSPDPFLAGVAPLALACAAGTSLVVDLDAVGPPWAGSSLASLVERQPRRQDLAPQRAGVAVLANGGIDVDTAAPVLRALVEGWPHVVLRLGHGSSSFEGVSAVVVHVLVPGWLTPPVGDRVVYQRTSLACPPPGPGLLLPVPSRRTLGRLLRGEAPGASRWVRAFRSVWRWA